MINDNHVSITGIINVLVTIVAVKVSCSVHISHFTTMQMYTHIIIIRFISSIWILQEGSDY